MNPIKILVVDDDKILCEIIVAILDTNGYEVTSVLNGEEAIEALEKERFHAVITDLKMGKVDGHSVMRYARKLEPETLLILMTGYCEEQSKQQAFDNGADYFFCKPIAMKELLQKLPSPTGAVKLTPA